MKKLDVEITCQMYVGLIKQCLCSTNINILYIVCTVHWICLEEKFEDIKWTEWKKQYFLDISYIDRNMQSPKCRYAVFQSNR